MQLVLLLLSAIRGRQQQAFASTTSASSWIGLRQTRGPRPSPTLSRKSTRGTRCQSSRLRVEAKVETLTYIVKRKDTLWSIAVQHDVTIEQLKELNPGLDAAIAVGQPIVVGIQKVETVNQALAPPKQAVAPPRAVDMPSAAPKATQASGATSATSKASSSTPATSSRLTVGIAAPPMAPLSSSNTFSPTVGFGMLTLGALAYFVTRRPETSPPVERTSIPESAPSLESTQLTQVTTQNGSAVPGAPVRRAAPAALAAIARHFPGAMEQESFIKACASELFNLGFSRDNCIALVNTCRDEVCRPLVSLIDIEFGHSFNMSGLGGLVNAGITGLKAGMSHSPEFMCDSSGVVRERYIFFAFPHISIGESGEAGSLLRRGRGRPSSACGALIAVKNSAANYEDESDKPYPADDYEFISLKRKVLAEPVCANCGPAGPSLVEVTKAALQVVTDDLEDLILKSANSETADYAVITGVQIHSGNQIPGEPFRLDRTVDYIAPGAMYAVVRGEKYMMHTEVDQITDIRSVKRPSVLA